MAKIETVIDLKAQTSGDESVKSLKAQIKDATNEATILAEKFGQFSPEARKAAQRVAELKDRMDDFREQVAALHPDKFNRIATVVGGIANGIQAAQGAMALFGSESEDVQKALLKVQGAMAFAQGLEGLTAVKNQFLTLAADLKGKVLTAFTTVGGAARALGGALGIGLVITAVTFVIENFDKFKKVAQKLIEFIPGLGTAIRGIAAAWDWVKEKVIAATDAMGLTDSKTDAMIEKMKKNIEFMKHAEELAEAQGKETYNMKRERILEEIKLMELQGGSEEKILEKRRELQLLDARKQKEIADKRTAAQKAAEEKEKAESEKAIKEAEAALDKANADIEKNFDKRKSLIDDYQDYESSEEAAKTVEQIEREKKAKQLEKQRREREDARFKKDMAIKDARDAQELADKEKQKRALAMVEAQAFANTSAILNDISDLFGRQTTAGKIAALAEVGISEGRALAQALSNATSPADPTNVATGGLAGIAKYLTIAAAITSTAVRARNIIKGGGGAGANVQSVKVAPTFTPITTGILPDNEDARGFNSQGRVYVLEGDITKTQGRVRRIQGVSVV